MESNDSPNIPDRRGWGWGVGGRQSDIPGRVMSMSDKMKCMRQIMSNVCLSYESEYVT